MHTSPPHLRTPQLFSMLAPDQAPLPFLARKLARPNYALIDG